MLISFGEKNPMEKVGSKNHPPKTENEVFWCFSSNHFWFEGIVCVMRLRRGSATILHECGSKSSLWSTWKGAIPGRKNVESVGLVGLVEGILHAWVLNLHIQKQPGATGHWCFWCGRVEESSCSDIANLNEDFGNRVQKITWMVWYGISHVLALAAAIITAFTPGGVNFAGGFLFHLTSPDTSSGDLCKDGTRSEKPFRT